MNLFSYCNNNPVMFFDYDGNVPTTNSDFFNFYTSIIEFKDGTLKEQAQDFVYWIGDEIFGL